MIDPALGAVRIADTPPVLEFGGDLDRLAGPLVDPFDFVVLGGADVHVDLVGLDADKARQRQAARGTKLRLRGRGAGGDRKRHQDQGTKGMWHAGRGIRMTPVVDALSWYAHLVQRNRTLGPAIGRETSVAQHG